MWLPRFVDDGVALAEIVTAEQPASWVVDLHVEAAAFTAVLVTVAAARAAPLAVVLDEHESSVPRRTSPDGLLDASP